MMSGLLLQLLCGFGSTQGGSYADQGWSVALGGSWICCVCRSGLHPRKLRFSQH